MPYINLNLSKKLTDEKIEEIKSEIGRAITIIPGKTEQALMVDVEDGKSIFLAGKREENAAFVDVAVYGDCPVESKRSFTVKIYDILSAALGTPKELVYLNFRVLDYWGANGELH